MNNDKNKSNRRNFLKYLIGSGIIGIASISGSLYNGCRHADPYGDQRFKEPHSSTILPTTDIDQKFVSKYVSDLKCRTQFFSGISKKDGIGFVRYELKVKDDSGKEKQLPLEKVVEIVEMGMITGKEVAEKDFKAYRSINEFLDDGKETERLIGGVPYTVPLAGTTNAEIEKLNKDSWEVITRHDKKSPALVVDFDNERVVGLYSVEDLEKLLDSRKELKDLRNHLNTRLFVDNKVLLESLDGVLAVNCFKKEEIETYLAKVGRSTSYLLDSLMDKDTILPIIKKFNSRDVGVPYLHEIGVKNISVVALNKDKKYEKQYPIFFEGQHALELYVDRSSGNLQSKIFSKPPKND